MHCAGGGFGERLFHVDSRSRLSDTIGLHPMLISKRAWQVIAVLIAFANVVRALYFDWSDVVIHMSIALLCALTALRWSRIAAFAATIVLVTSILAFAFYPVPDDWAEVEAGDTWSEVRRTLGTPVYEGTNLARARAMARGYSSPSPIRFPNTRAVAIYIRGEHALWVFHDGNVVEATFIGGS